MAVINSVTPQAAAMNDLLSNKLDSEQCDQISINPSIFNLKKLKAMEQRTLKYVNSC
jgi:hypothetical protein